MILILSNTTRIFKCSDYSSKTDNLTTQVRAKIKMTSRCGKPLLYITSNDICVNLPVVDELTKLSHFQPRHIL